MTEIETKKIPKLRFPGFSDEWEEKKFGDIYARIRNGFVGTATPFYVKNGHKYIQGKDVKNGTINDTVDVFVSEKFHRKNSKSILKSNDIVMVQSGHVGESAVVPNYYDGANCHALIVMTPDIPTCSDFFVDYFYSPTGKKTIAKIKTGNTIEHILASDMKKMAAYSPSVNEQKKIAGFLGVVDDRISALQKKKELLQKYKMGIIQKIFSQEISFKPARPAGQTGGDENKNNYPDWQEKTIDEIAYSETSPLSANQIEGRSGQYKVYGASGVLQTLDKYHYDEEYISIVKDGAGVGRISFCEPQSSVLGTMIVVQPKKNNNKRFLYYLLNLIDFKKYTTGSTIPHVYFKQYSKQKFFIPSFGEQQKIADLLTTIDDKIELTKKELEQAKKFKKALLQQMFV